MISAGNHTDYLTDRTRDQGLYLVVRAVVTVALWLILTAWGGGVGGTHGRRSRTDGRPAWDIEMLVEHVAHGLMNT